MSKKTLSQAIADKLRSCRAAYDSIPFHNKPVSITDRPVPEMVVLPAEAAAIQSQLSDVMAQSNKIPTPASILLQPDDLAHLVPPKEPKPMFVGAREPGTLTYHRYTIRHK